LSIRSVSDGFELRDTKVEEETGGGAEDNCSRAKKRGETRRVDVRSPERRVRGWKECPRGKIHVT